MNQKKAGQYVLSGKYELLERLGQGGMGEVWKARDTQLQRFVALKLLRADLRDDPDFAAYFTREARLVAALRHRNIVQIHDFHMADDASGESQAYMVMDYIAGGTLAEAIKEMVRQGSFWPASEIVELFTGISLGLDYAHQQGMIHRDIKPANILLDQSLSGGRQPGEPILTDFGIARWQGSGSTVTGLLGTPLYISPEQAQSRPVNARSDLYSLGIILYEVLTGNTPFRANNPMALMLQHVDEPPPPPERFNPQITPALKAVVLKSIAKDPAERFSSASEMTRALAEAFHLPVPALLQSSLDETRAVQANPLQPQRGLTPFPATPVPLLPDAQALRWQSQPGLAPYPPGHPGPWQAGFPSGQPQVGANPLNYPQSGLSYPQPGAPTRASGATVAGEQRADLTGPPAPITHQPAKRRSRAWLVLLLSGIVVLLLGLGAAIVGPRLLARSSSGTTPTAAALTSGQLRFLSSSGAAHGSYDEVEIDLSNVPSPPTGRAYYAWLMQANSESLSVPHWSLQVASGSIHDLYQSQPAGVDLLAPTTQLLITVEDTTSTPVVPYPDLTHHIYFATITHTTPATLTFRISSCPQSNVNSAQNPCR